MAVGDDYNVQRDNSNTSKNTNVLMAFITGAIITAGAMMYNSSSNLENRCQIIDAKKVSFDEARPLWGLADELSKEHWGYRQSWADAINILNPNNDNKITSGMEIPTELKCYKISKDAPYHVNEFKESK